MFKNWGSPCYFRRNQTVFVYIVGFIFMVFLVEKLIYTINKWFTFVPSWFSQQDNLSNLINLGVYVNGWPKYARILKLKLMWPIIWWMIFFRTLTAEDPSIGKILSKKKCGGVGLLSEKTEALHAELKEKVEAATSSYSTAVDFL